MPRRPLLVVLALLFAAPLLSAEDDSVSPEWPETTRSARPWTRWWWPGSTVDETGVAAQLAAFRDAGLGGVEITPIYGVRGYESRNIEFLSPRWMEMLRYTAVEARELGLGVDMATGTGWPFGGPWVSAADGSHRLAFADGVLTGRPTAMKVKRAAPGAEGLVVDPYSTDALGRYLSRFSSAFSEFPRDLVRGQFHDSFEYYNAEWTPALVDTFREMHGYDLNTRAAELTGRATMPEEQLARLKADYRATLAKLHSDYLKAWVRWSHERGFVVRNQSHGAPANLLDLYGAVDIPETETFGSTPFPIPGLRQEWTSDRDLPESLVLRLASSAGHVMGRQLVSSETCTWLREHWQVALSFTKPEIDRLFTDGINHVFYHGTVYSPTDAAWPGWLFYASTQFHPHNSWWRDFSALNAYVTRVQSFLQAGRPDNDILLYWPFHDVLHDAEGLMKQFGVHEPEWLLDSACGRLAADLLAEGYAFDYISDEQLRATATDGNALVSPGGTRYRFVLVPSTRHMPPETLGHLVDLARRGATVVLAGAPGDVPGLGRLDERRAEFHRHLAALPDSGARVVSDPLAALRELSVPHEPVAATGLRHIRRAFDDGHVYFFTNLTAAAHDGWITLGTPAASALLLNPLTGRTGSASMRPGPAGEARVYMQLAAGQSLLLRTRAYAERSGASAAWRYSRTAGEPVVLSGEWQVEFVSGGPDLPAPLRTRDLRSWTELGGDDARRFAGTARYRLEFTKPDSPADAWLLDLGDVRESARVRLNGEEITTAWSLPFQVRLDGRLKPGRNVLELEVTNLAANRIRDLDRRKVDWKIMREINFVDIRYRPFDASEWPDTPSGLLGPVTLQPLRDFIP